MLSITKLICLLTPFVASEALFDYAHIDQWAGYCQEGNTPGKPQQSPIDIRLADVDLKDLLTLSFTHLDEGSLELTQNLKRSPEGQLTMLLEGDKDAGSLVSIAIEGINYSLNHVHSHWGASEHTLDGEAADGNFHLVFKADDSPAAYRWGPLGTAFAVIEIKIVFDKERGITTLPRCPAPSPEDLKHTHAGLSCSFHDHDHHHQTIHHGESVSASSGGLLGALGTDTHFHQSGNGAASYDGSLTTPPCAGNVKFLVVHDPVVVKDLQGDWLGCKAFAHAHPSHKDDAGECKGFGNVRPTQLVQDFTTIRRVHVEPTKSTPVLGQAMSYYQAAMDSVKSFQDTVYDSMWNPFADITDDTMVVDDMME